MATVLALPLMIVPRSATPPGQPASMMPARSSSLRASVSTTIASAVYSPDKVYLPRLSIL